MRFKIEKLKCLEKKLEYICAGKIPGAELPKVLFDGILKAKY